MAIQSKGGQASYGFKWHQGELIQNPEEAKIYAQIFDLFLVHQRKQTVAKALNEQGHRTRKGGEFSHTTISHLLKNHIAKGIHRSSIVETAPDGTKENTIIETPVEPIVSTKIWNHVQAIMEEQQGKQSRPPSQDTFIGKISCCCGKIMELPSKSPDYKCPSCSEAISIDDVWKIAEHTFSQLTLPKKEELTRKAQTSLFDTKVDPSSNLKQVDKEIEKLFELHTQEAISNDVFSARYAPLEQRKKQLESQLKKRKSHKFSESFIDEWKKLSREMQRIMVENLIDSISVTPEKNTVSLYPLFNFAQQVTTTRP